MDDLPEIATTPGWRQLMRDARKAAGMSQADLALKVDVSQAAVSGIESGAIGQSTAVQKISEVLRIPLPIDGAPADELADLAKFAALRRMSPDQFRALLAAADGLISSLDSTPGTSPGKPH